MRTLLVCALMLVACILSGCILEVLQPLYTSDTLTFDPALIGTWQNPENDTTYTFSDDGVGGYHLFVRERGTITRFTFHLVKLGDHLFGDLYPPLPVDLSRFGYNGGNLIPVHNVYLIKRIQPTLRYQYVNTDWLDTFLAANPQAIAHGRVDCGPDDKKGLPVLTASTADLQAFFLKLADMPHAWDEDVLVPVPPASQAAP